MLSLFILFLALTTMFGLWGLAWWLLKQPLACASMQHRPSQSHWRNEPTRGQAPPPDVPVPSPRTHDNSDSNTQFFSRAVNSPRAKIEEETEILHDQPFSAERTAFLTSSYPKVVKEPPPAPRRKTRLFGGPEPSPRG
jgi:hypothetical protein